MADRQMKWVKIRDSGLLVHHMGRGTYDLALLKVLLGSFGALVCNLLIWYLGSI